MVATLLQALIECNSKTVERLVTAAKSHEAMRGEESELSGPAAKAIQEQYQPALACPPACLLACARARAWVEKHHARLGYTYISDERARAFPPALSSSRYSPGG